MKTKSKLKLTLQHTRNPDLMFGQGNGTGYWGEEPCDPRSMTVEVKDLKEAQQKFNAWVKRNELGGGNITRKCGEVRKGRALVAVISYNGRVWSKHYGEAGCEEIQLDANVKTAAQHNAEGWVDSQPAKLATYRAALTSAGMLYEVMCDMGLEEGPLSSLKQAAKNHGIEDGAELQKFLAWSAWELAHPPVAAPLPNPPAEFCAVL